ncbi:MAG TPA: hypothetical protein VH025_09290 [Solirubrobacteraceae bacterium]|jgi:hypothetical protein|nr:hypothetical protein [Solirubrobacteraceae bacterium]
MKPRSVLATSSLLALLLGAAILAGCGGSSSSSGNGVADKTPAEILAATKAATDTATSVHVAGSIVSDKSPITLDMSLLAGKGGRGQLSEGGLSFELIQVGGTVYIKGSPAFYKHIGGSAAAQLLQGKWLKAPSSDSDFASLGQLTNLHQLVDQTLSSHGALKKSGTTTINGQKVVGVTDTTKGGTLYIATTGKPYPVEISKGGSPSSGGKVTFDRWNGNVTLAAPKNAIDVAQLQSAGQ